MKFVQTIEPQMEPLIDEEARESRFNSQEITISLVYSMCIYKGPTY